jgi:hypothetical protein
MPQVSLYIDEDTLKKLEERVKQNHESLSKWVGDRIKNHSARNIQQGFLRYLEL